MPKVIQVCLSKAGFICHAIISGFGKKTIRRRRNLRFIGIFASLGFFALVFMTIFPIYHKPNLADAAPSVPATTEINITSGRDTATLNLLPVNDAGVFASTTTENQIEFSVYTNNLTGYILTIGADDNEGYLTDQTTGYTLSSITSNMDRSTFDNSSNNGKWGYQPSMLNSVANTDFVPSPTATDTVLNQTRCANGQTTIYGGVTYVCPDEDKYTIGLGARANLDQPAGFYTNTFTLYAIGNLMPYILMYADGTGDSSVKDLPPNYEGVVDPATTTTVDVPISEASPTRTGYEFKYWCEGTVSNNGTVCVGDVYRPSTPSAPSYYVFRIDESGVANTKILYAVWTPKTYQVNLDNTTATTLGSTIAHVTFGSSNIYAGTSGTDPIVNPSESRTISGFSTSYNNASGATVTYSSYSTCTSATNCRINYNFEGWYTTASSGSKVINTGGTLDASTPYTDSHSRWNSPSDQTLYARFTPPGEGVELPTINKTGYECGWGTSTNTNVIEYESGDIIAPHENLVLYGVCNIKSYMLTVKPNGGTWSGSTNDQTFSQNYLTTKTIPNPSVNATFKITYNANGQGATYNPTPTGLTRAFTGWSNIGAGTLSGTTYTFGAGDGVLTANYESSKSLTLPTITKRGHTCWWARGSASGARYSGGLVLEITRNEDFFAVCEPNPYTLEVRPNGGTWNGSTENQKFTQLYDTTKYIADPSKNAVYEVKFDGNGQNASFDGSKLYPERAFTGWSLVGNGNWNASTKTYTYSDGENPDDTLTATYNTTSNSFKLPAISKRGHTCKWAEGTTSGTKYDGGASRTVKGNTTYYATCTPNPYTLTVKPNGGTWNGSTNNQNFTQLYGTTKHIADPSKNAVYEVKFNGNGQNADFDATSLYPERAFTGWSLVGNGNWNASTKTYTYSDGENPNDTLTANYNTTSNSFKLPTITKLGHTCKWAEGSASGTKYDYGTSRTVKANTTYYAVCTPNEYILTVNPNGGAYEGNTSAQTFKQKYATAKTINNPSSNATYTISFNGNGQNASFDGSNLYPQRAFAGWTKSGYGDWNANAKRYTYGAGNGTLTANYNATSNSFALPAISKAGHTCQWAEGSASGTKYDYGTSRTVKANTTYYAVCTAKSYKLTVNPNGGVWNGSSNSQSFTQNFGTEKYIPDPTNGPSYSIGYNDNGQGASYSALPTSVERPFTGWSHSGGGSLNGTTYKYGASDGTLTANYSGTSNGFYLPGISKSGYNCQWDVNGTRYNGGQYVTIGGGTTFYAVCSPAYYTITIKTADGIGSVTLNGVTCWSSSGCDVSLQYGSTYNLSASVNGGYMFNSWSASGGSIANPGASSTTYTVWGDATITPSVSTVDMQNYDASICPTDRHDSVPDSRDGTVYTVRKINNKCWMTKNLEIGCNGNRVLTSSDSNVSSSWNTADAGPWRNDIEADQDAHKLCGPAGGWYNYISASAGGSATAEASQDICPKNWRLPTKDELNGLTSYAAKVAFNPTNGGGDIEEYGIANHKDTSYYWSKSHYVSYNHWYLRFQNESSMGAISGDGRAYYGFFIRCVHI